MKDTLIHFSERLKLQKAYDDYIKEKGIKDCPMSVVAFLQIHNMLNEEKVHEFTKSIELETSKGAKNEC